MPKPQIPLVPEKEVVVPKKKKEEEKKVPSPPPPKLKPKLEAIKIVPEKEIKLVPVKITPTGPRPVIPTEDTCCQKVCTILNNTIHGLEQALEIREEEKALQELYIGREKEEEKELVTILPPGIGPAVFGEKPEVIERPVRGKRRKLIIGGAVAAKQIKVIKTKLSVLKDFRYDLKNKDSCKCIEEIELIPIRKSK